MAASKAVGSPLERTVTTVSALIERFSSSGVPIVSRWP